MKKATLLVLFSCLLFIANAQQFDTTEVEKGFNVFGNKYILEMPAMESFSSTNLICNAGADIELCMGETTVLGGVPTANENSTYYWEGSDGKVYTTENPIVTPTKTTTYYLLASAEDSDEQASDQVVVTVSYCCIIPSNALDFSNVLSSNIGASTYDEIIYINYLFTANTDFEFSNCSIYLGENAKIDIINSEVVFKDCTLQACTDNMWDGIYADNQNESITFIGTTAIQAKNAIFGQFNATINVSNNSRFESNHIGVLLKHYTDASNVNVINSFFLKPSPLLAPHSMSIGIDVYDVSKLQIGDYSNPNSFIRLDLVMRSSKL